MRFILKITKLRCSDILYCLLYEKLLLSPGKRQLDIQFNNVEALNTLQLSS